MANSGLIPQLVERGDLIISDQLNHGSIIDGVRLCRADRAIYQHNNMEDLDRVLKEAENHDPEYRRILVITDGVFSMDGDIAPLKGIAELAEEHGAMVYVDDAHGEGILGEGGRGIVSHFKLDHRKVQVEMGTFSKAYGVVGGHISGSEDLVRFALNRSRTWLLSSSHPPPVVAACIAAIDILETEPWHVENLWKNTNYFKKAVQDLGFNTGKSETPIIPIIVGESNMAKELSDKLYAKGIFVVPIVFPMVALDQARIRVQMHAQLKTEELERVIETLAYLGRKLHII
jgi:glycine C-acetyltransferase